MSAKRRRVEVKWIDACTPTTHWNPGIILEPDKIVSVGLLKKKSKSAVVLIQSDADGGSQGGFLVIPRGAVKKIRRLK
jgi:hypothetical protein